MTNSQLSLLPTIAHPKERPLLMQGAMVRATLNDLKTQTRRLQDLDRVNQSPDDWELLGIKIEPKKKDLVSTAIFRHKDGEEVAIACRYGRPGDLLWIRETWGETYSGGHTLVGCSDCIAYKADGVELQSGEKWKPSIFMPRAMSRLSIGITDIRIERLQSISESDAIAEGIERSPVHSKLWKTCQKNDGAHTALPTMSYKSLWDSINGKTHPWDNNPWVWAIDFKK